MMNKNIYPLTFSPVFQDYIWGGRNLETVLGRKLPPGKVAESWEISGHPTSPTSVDYGPLAGQTLPQVLNLLGTDLVGTRSQPMLDRGKFPLLIKLLDANKPLSVQVHPDDEYATTHENGELGKTEMWYILHAKPDAYLIYGLKAGVTPARFRQRLDEGRLEECLHKLPVKPGDAVFIPSGSLHAIMDGIVLAEIQQSSDVTYRVYDWNRVDEHGHSRPLHVEKAMDVINFDQVEPGPYAPRVVEKREGLTREIISSCPYFVVERVSFSAGDDSFKGECSGETFEIWGIMSGHGQINWSGDPLDFPAVRFVLLPATLGRFEISVSEPSTLLRVSVPA